MLDIAIHINIAHTLLVPSDWNQRFGTCDDPGVGVCEVFSSPTIMTMQFKYTFYIVIYIVIYDIVTYLFFYWHFFVFDMNIMINNNVYNIKRT